MTCNITKTEFLELVAKVSVFVIAELFPLVVIHSWIGLFFFPGIIIACIIMAGIFGLWKKFWGFVYDRFCGGAK